MKSILLAGLLLLSVPSVRADEVLSQLLGLPIGQRPVVPAALDFVDLGVPSQILSLGINGISVPRRADRSIEFGLRNLADNFENSLESLQILRDLDIQLMHRALTPVELQSLRKSIQNLIQRHVSAEMQFRGSGGSFSLLELIFQTRDVANLKLLNERQLLMDMNLHSGFLTEVLNGTPPEAKKERQEFLETWLKALSRRGQALSPGDLGQILDAAAESQDLELVQVLRDQGIQSRDPIISRRGLRQGEGQISSVEVFLQQHFPQSLQAMQAPHCRILLQNK